MKLVFDKPLTRLQAGHVILLSGIEHRVILVNDCRARVVPLKKVKKSYKTLEGEDVSFEAKGKAVNISPNSEVPIVRFEALAEVSK